MALCLSDFEAEPEPLEPGLQGFGLVEDFDDLERATVVNAGHFIHMERPTETARLILDFVSA